MEENFLKAVQAVYSPPATENANGSQAEVVVPETPPAETPVVATIAAETPANAQENIAPEAVAPEAPPAPSNEPYNYWADLDQKTEGLVKDEDSLKTVLEKFKSYDTLATEKAELEKNQWKPINDYVATFDKLIRDGANADQVKAFVKLNEYGSLDDLKPIEAKVAKMVLIDGYSEDVARKLVNRNFDFEQFDETLPEQKDDADILREELRISAKNDLEALKEYRKDLSVVHNPEKENAEAAKLAEVAKISTYNKTVEQEAGNIAKNFPAKMDYEFKIGDDTLKFEDTIDKDFLEKQLPTLVADYFKDSLDPINTETINQAYSYAYGEYLKGNVGKMLERAAVKAHTQAVEATVNKYENRSGLPKAQENTVIAANEDGLIAFQKKLLGKS